MSVLERYTPTWPFYTPWRTTNHLSAWPWKNVHFGLWTVSPGYLSVISCRNPFFFSNLWNKVQKIRVCVFLKFVFTSVCNASVSQPLDAVEFDLNTKCHEFVFSSASNQPRIFGISKLLVYRKNKKYPMRLRAPVVPERTDLSHFPQILSRIGNGNLTANQPLSKSKK